MSPSFETDDKPKVVYVVDDDESVRQGLCRLLRSAHLDVRAYGSAKEFLENVRDIPNGCVLLDFTMPQMTGSEVMTALKAQGIRMPVIMLSAHEEELTPRNAKELGALLLLRKPVDDRALLDAINWAGGDNGLPAEGAA